MQANKNDNTFILRGDILNQNSFHVWSSGDKPFDNEGNWDQFHGKHSCIRGLTGKDMETCDAALGTECSSPGECTLKLPGERHGVPGVATSFRSVAEWMNGGWEANMVGCGRSELGAFPQI